MILSKYISNSIVGAFRAMTMLCFGKNGLRIPNQVTPAGIDSVPVPNTIGVYEKTSNSDSPGVIIGYILQKPKANEGETRIFATDLNGNEMCRIWAHSDGTIELGGTGAAGSNINHAMQWEAANTALQIQVTHLNIQLGLISTNLLALGGDYAPPALTLDLTAAKLTNIKTQ